MIIWPFFLGLCLSTKVIVERWTRVTHVDLDPRVLPYQESISVLNFVVYLRNEDFRFQCFFSRAQRGLNFFDLVSPTTSTRLKMYHRVKRSQWIILSVLSKIFLKRCKSLNYFSEMDVSILCLVCDAIFMKRPRWTEHSNKSRDISTQTCWHKKI